jgi:hypothetical protein
MKLKTLFLTAAIILAVTPLHADITRYYDAKGNYTDYSQIVADEDLKAESKAESIHNCMELNKHLPKGVARNDCSDFAK